MNIDDFSSDRDWQAYRYVSRDMSASEVETFEQQLAIDPELCGVVAELQLLCDAIVASGVPTTSPRRQRFWSKSGLVWTAVAVAGLLAVTAWLNEADFLPLGSQEGAVVSVLPDARVLSVWSSLQDDTESVDAAPGFEEESLDLVAETVAVPDWMLAAVMTVAADETEGVLPDVNESRGADSL
ncbi:MAG: hypothetical protein KDA90_13400 [Planctomycetaceae bacterium]|nr:hypothetical protein [Planctomycetaceae bacterium]